jgi:predicted cation transporter
MVNEMYAGVEIGLIPIFLAVLLGPLLIKRIEQNLEMFLFLMGICAVAISRSWHIGIVEEAIQEPLVVGIVLTVLLAGLTAHYIRPDFLRNINAILLDRITMKVIFLEIVVVLGLLAAIITPILSFFMLVEAVNHLPLTRKTRAKITILGCLSISLGAALALVDGSSSAIAITRMQGELPSAGFLPPELQSLYIFLSILALGLIAMFFAEENINSIRKQAYGKASAHKRIAIWSARVCMFTGALLLIGVAFGVNI